MFTSCIYNNIKFNCCQRFLPVDTYEGKCYAFNSHNAIGAVRAKLQKHLVSKTDNFLFKMDKIGHSPPSEGNPGNLSIELAHPDVYAWYVGNVDVPSKMYTTQNQYYFKDSKNFQTADVYLRVEVNYALFFYPTLIQNFIR